MLNRLNLCLIIVFFIFWVISCKSQEFEFDKTVEPKKNIIKTEIINSMKDKKIFCDDKKELLISFFIYKDRLYFLSQKLNAIYVCFFKREKYLLQKKIELPRKSQFIYFSENFKKILVFGQDKMVSILSLDGLVIHNFAFNYFPSAWHLNHFTDEKYHRYVNWYKYDVFEFVMNNKTFFLKNIGTHTLKNKAIIFSDIEILPKAVMKDAIFVCKKAKIYIYKKVKINFSLKQVSKKLLFVNSQDKKIISFNLYYEDAEKEFVPPLYPGLNCYFNGSSFYYISKIYFNEKRTRYKYYINKIQIKSLFK